ncbi:MAG: type II CRISPR RNA-guided endonuclease Cas9 [Lachnospiraceae bacterium]|nr:type II CRISPR RNA-guided endonuclease Cas9 [Lachnospiraceae bacterium]
MDLNYRIGLDIGITSVGWAVLENNSKDEPVRIVDLGVRLFEAAEVPKTGAALAEERRNARSTRRRLRRRRHRLDRIKYLLQEQGMIEIDSFMERYHSAHLPDVYQLRCEALDRKLKEEEFAQILLHIAKHRGFHSTRKAELIDKKDKETGAVLSATKENKKLMETQGYRTVGEMIYKDEKFRTGCNWNEQGYILTPRNKQGDYKHTMLRAMLVEEVHTIFQRQRELGNPNATEELEEKYLTIMTSQRSFDMGPGSQPDGTPSPYAMEGFGDRVGLCTLEPKENQEPRGAKAAYTSELFVALQKINHLRLVDKNGNSRGLTKEEREILLELLHKHQEVKYAAIRKNLKLDIKYRFNTLNYSGKKKDKEGNIKSEEERIKEAESAKFVSLKNYHDYKKKMPDRMEQMSKEEKISLLDEVGAILTLYKNDDTRTREFQKLGLHEEEINGLLELNPTKFQHVSIKAMRKIMPYLEQGLTYDKACEQAGYQFQGAERKEKAKLLKGKEITDIINEITNPVVKRSVAQTVKVINAIIQKYGSPQAVNIELAREMSKNYQDRQKMSKQMSERQSENERAKKEIQEWGIPTPNGKDILKYRLWHDQSGICLYSGKKIPLEELFTGAYDIDHILPYSITFDDSYQNKVLVTAEENRQKGNRIPYEYFGENDPKRWREFEGRVNSFVRDYRKQQRLLKQEFTLEERKEFKERNLNDTKYITRVIYNMIREHLEFAPYSRMEKKRQVYAVNGGITSYLRKRWRLPAKDRSIDTHHAMDAVVIACCTNGMIQKISRNIQGRELRYARGYVAKDVETGEMISRDDFTSEEWDETFGVHLPRPWDYFKEELEIRMGEDPRSFIETHPDVARDLDYPVWFYENDIIRPIFVSRMPNRKVTGAAHADTIRSPREYKKTGNVLTKTALTELKLDKKTGEIANYYQPESDKPLYQALKKQLLLYSGDAKKAFAEPFYKPKADGTKGNLVRKVKTYDKLTLGVKVNSGNGIAANANGAMVRVDVYCTNGKYYFVPVYIADVVRKKLPTKAVVVRKPYSEWKEMEDKDFLFSLYSRDLISFKSKRGKNVACVDGTTKMMNEEIVYYYGANISTASFNGKSHDGRCEFDGLGIQNLEYLKKYQVDILGNVTEVKQEQRMGFH